MNYADALNPIGELEQRVPDAGLRRALEERLSDAKRDARSGHLSLERYVALRKALATRSGKPAPLTREAIDRAFRLSSQAPSEATGR